MQGKYVDAGWVKGSRVVLTDRELLEAFRIQPDRIQWRWQCRVTRHEPSRSTLITFDVPMITTMGRKAESRVHLG